MRVSFNFSCRRGLQEQHGMCIREVQMRLPDYIRQVGTAKFSRLMKVKERTAISWMYRARYPKKETAQRIVEKTPVTMDGIYGT